MFDLDTALATWRDSLRHQRMFSTEDLDELEAHVRDYVAAQIEGGIAPEAAFRAAVRRMGDRALMEAEYEKVFWIKARQQARLWDAVHGELMMWLNYFKIALRSLHRDRFYTALNMLGLVVGLTSFLLLAVFVYHELSYDRFHRDADQVYRLTSEYQASSTSARFALVSGHADVVLHDVPEIEATTAFFSNGRDLLLRRGDRVFTERRGYWVDEDFAEVFTFPLLYGEAGALFDEPNALVLTAEAAQKYFGETNPVGETLEWIESGEVTSLRVTGVFAPLPSQSHLQFDYLLAGAVMGDHWKTFFFAPDADPMVYLYFRVNQKMTLSAAQQKVDAATAGWLTARFGPDYQTGETGIRLAVQPLTEVYFNADAAFEPTAGGNLTYVKILIVVALFMLLVAGINYVNLSTARSARRAREVGVRKVLGSSQNKLVAQFLLEAVVLSLLATAASLLLAEWVLQMLVPEVLGVSLHLFSNPLLIGVGVGTGALLGVLAGLFPAFRMTRFETVAVLKGNVEVGRASVLSLRQVLVTLQFVVTICLLAGALVILRQLDYLQTRGIGYAQENVVTVRYSFADDEANWQAFREAVKTVPGIIATGATQYDPIGDQNTAAFYLMGATRSDEAVNAVYNTASYDYLETMGMVLAEGRSFSRDFPADTSAILINETMRRALGLDEAVGQRVWAWFTPPEGATVVGVVRDFHFQSFNNRIAPLVLRMRPDSELMLVARLAGQHTRPALAEMARRWQAAGLVAPFAYQFLDDRFQQLLEKETQISVLLGVFTGVCVLIACLGLIGLVSYVTERRRKEIGLRKVMGASRLDIIARINRQFAGAVAVALLLAVPLAMWGIQRWLDQFAYRIALSPLDFVVTGLFILLVAFTTVSLQCFKAASANPVESLRYE